MPGDASNHSAALTRRAFAIFRTKRRAASWQPVPKSLACLSSLHYDRVPL